MNVPASAPPTCARCGSSIPEGPRKHARIGTRRFCSRACANAFHNLKRPPKVAGALAGSYGRYDPYAY